MEYPLRPPLFSLNLVTGVTDPAEGDFLLDENDGAKWFNELRAMEAEVCCKGESILTQHG